MAENKINLIVKPDKQREYYYFWKWNMRVQLCWDTRIAPFWLFQASDAVEKLKWKEWFSLNFKRDLRDILEYMAENKMPIFTLYELAEVIHCKED